MRISKINFFRVFVIVCSISVIIFTCNFYINYKYSLITNDFYSNFNQCKFTEAKKIISNDTIYLKLKKKDLTNDLNTYFSSVVNKLCNDILTEKVKEQDAIVVFKEIMDYNIINTSLNKLLLSIDSNYIPENVSDYTSILNVAIESYKKNEFTKALSLLKKIPETAKEYKNAQTYISKCISTYKENLFAQADALAADDYYTKAIELLNNADKLIVTPEDADIDIKKKEIDTARENYLASANGIDTTSDTLLADQETSGLLLQNISSSNINTLNIESSTNYLIHVNLAEQKTNIYEGYSNNWNLVKSFVCSAGLPEEPTPTGIFTITSRGDWFFSDEYGQGGKYWVQFWGDYLFHSLPYDKTQTEVLDYTLGTPASHGCIRLKDDEAKWIYDNITDDTKVIIN